MSRNASPKFRREPPSLRREALVAATLACLRKHGHEGASVRRISAEAGVSAGLINHHFPGVADLIAAAYEHLALALLHAVARHASDTSLVPRQRLRRFFEASFGPELLDPELFKAWLVFWSMAPHNAQVRAVHRRTWSAYRATLASLLRQLRGADSAPAFRLRPAAMGLAALLDGLWLEASLNPDTFRPADAIALCEHWTDALCSGQLAGTSIRPHARSGGTRRSRRTPAIRS